MSILLPQRAWFGDRDIEIDFPKSWDISVQGIAADELPALSPEQLGDLVKNPLGRPPLRVAAKGCREVAIIFDDLTRPTPVSQVLPAVIGELEKAGVGDDQIRFIAALGAHGAHTRIDFEKKLGAGVLARFKIFNHNPYDNCTDKGTTRRGTPVQINSEAVACDLMIGIGSILPHPFMGFGGGGKIVMPGIASMKSIKANHMLAEIDKRSADRGSKDNLGCFENNEAQQDVAEAAALAGLDFKVDLLVNSRRKIVGAVAGDHVKAFRAGVKRAQQLYGTAKPEGMDLVVVNANAKTNAATTAILFAAQALKEEGGDLVLVADNPVGQTAHYLLGAFGTSIGGPLWNPRFKLPERVKRVIVLSSYPDRAGGDWFAPADKLSWADQWGEVRTLLEKEHGAGTKAAVFIDGTMQYYKKSGSTKL